MNQPKRRMNEYNRIAPGPGGTDRSSGKRLFEMRAQFFNKLNPEESLSRKFAVFSIYLYIASIYVISYSDYNIISRLLFASMLVFTMIDFFINRVNAVFDKPTILILLFLAYFMISSLWTVSQKGVADSIITELRLIVLFFVIKLNIRSMGDVRRILNAIMVGTILMCVYTVYYYGVGHIIHIISIGRRIGQEINQVNGMGLYCAILITIMTYMILYERKYYYLIFMPLAVLVQLGCGSRKGFMLVIVGVFMVAFFRTENKKLPFLFGALVILAILLYIVYSLADTNYFFYRILQVLSLVDKDVDLTENSVRVRGRMIQFGLELFRKKPVFGYGPRQFEYYYGLRYGSPRPPHNTYIQILCGFGLVGFSLYYGIYFYFFRYIIPLLKKKITYISLFVSIVVVMLMNDFGANMLNHKYAYIFFALISCYIIQARNLEALELRDDREFGGFRK